VQEVHNTTGAAAGFVRQVVTFSHGKTIDLDPTQTDAASHQTLDQLALLELDSSKVSAAAGTGNLALDASGLTDGQVVTYRGPSTADSFDVDQATYTSSSLKLTGTGFTPFTSRPLAVGEQIQFLGGTNDGKVVTIQSITGDTLTFLESTLTAGAETTTFKLTGAPIGELVVGTDYKVALVAGKVELRYTDAAHLGDPVLFAGSGGSTSGFSYVKQTLTFAPSTAVDADEDWITLPNHGLQTGEVVRYRTDPTHTVSVPLFGFLGTSTSSANAIPILTVTIPDAPVAGLDNMLVYYVVRVDADHIRLVGSRIAADNAMPIDLSLPASGTPSGTFGFPGEEDGITISATLESDTDTEAGVELSDEEQPWSDVA
jgi:hypothetical protein